MWLYISFELLQWILKKFSLPQKAMKNKRNDLTYTGGLFQKRGASRKDIRQHHNADFGTALRKPILGTTIGSSEGPKRGRNIQTIGRRLVVGFRSSEGGKRGIRRRR